MFTVLQPHGKFNFLLIILLSYVPVFTVPQRAVAEDIYLGLSYDTDLNLLDPWHDNGSIESFDYIGGRKTGKGLVDYDADGETITLGYRGAYFQELSIELRDTKYNFSSDNNKPRVNLAHSAIVALAHAKQNYAGRLFNKSIYYRIYGGAGIGKMIDITSNINTANNYNSQILLVGVSFANRISPATQTPHRFILEYSQVGADAKKREVMVQDGTMRGVGRKILVSNITLGYSIDLF